MSPSIALRRISIALAAAFASQVFVLDKAEAWPPPAKLEEMNYSPEGYVPPLVPAPSATPGDAAPPRPSPLSSQDRTHSLSLAAWTPTGPAPIINGNTPGSQPTTARIGGIAAHPSDANTIYVAAVGGGIWKTTDGGASWAALTDPQLTLFSYAVAIAPSNPDIVYAGTGEPTNSILSFYGRGVLKSTNGGVSWTLLGSSVFDRRAISRIVVHPTDPDIVYVATGGGVNGLTGNRGVWKSTDGGMNWTNLTTPQITAGSFAGNYSDLLMHPTDPQTLYCAVGQYNGAVKNGVYVTTNGGTNWAVSGNHPTGNTLGRISIAMSRSNPLVLYSIIQDPVTFGLLKMMKTTDGGANWTEVTGVPNFMGGQGWYDQCIAVDPTNPDVVYVGGQSGTNAVLKSEDGGTSWHSIIVDSFGNGPHVDHHAMTFDANGKLLEANDGGIWRLSNPTLGSLEWSDLNGNMQITQFIGIAMDPANVERAYGGSQDNGTKMFTGVLGWTAIRGGDGGQFRVDPSNPLILYHTFQYPRGSGTWERSDNGGATWAVKQNGINTTEPGNFYVYLVLDPANPSRLLTGTDRVYETVDRGENWVPISAPNTNGWGGSTRIDAIAVAESDINTIYATAGAAIYVTFNRGATWALRNSGTVADHFKDIQVDPTDAMTAYVVRDRFGGGSKVFRTTNGGVSWTSIGGNLPDIPVQSFALDPNNPGPADDVYFVGTDIGVYRSKDGGATWAPHATGMPNVTVFDLEINQNTGVLMAGTHGRGTFQILLPASPSIADLTDQSMICGDAYTSPTPSATGTPPLSWSLVSGPPGAAIDSGTGVVSVAAVPASASPYTITIKAENDGGGFDTETWTLTARPGDFNGDGVCDMTDLPDFVDHLLGTSATHPCAADTNFDAALDGLDVEGWLGCGL